MRIIHRKIVSAMIFSKDGKLFLGRKKADGGGVYSDCWHIPGGGVDDGETSKEALKREILEETGIDITKCKYELIDNEGKGVAEKILKDTGERVTCEMDFEVYEIIIDDKNSNEIKISLNDDLEEYQWVEMSDLPKIKLTPPGAELFKKLGHLQK